MFMDIIIIIFKIHIQIYSTIVLMHAFWNFQGFKIIDPQTLVTQNALDALNAFVKKGGADGGSEVGDRETKNASI